MTIHIVDIEQVTHTCPAEAGPHPYDIRRTLVDTIDGGACRTPVTIRVGDTVAQVACGRHEPVDRQCPACRTIVTQRAITDRSLEVAA